MVVPQPDPHPEVRLPGALVPPLIRHHRQPPHRGRCEHSASKDDRKIAEINTGTPREAFAGSHSCISLFDFGSVFNMGR